MMMNHVGETKEFVDPPPINIITLLITFKHQLNLLKTSNGILAENFFFLRISSRERGLLAGSDRWRGEKGREMDIYKIKK